VLLRDFSFGIGIPVVGIIRSVDDKHCYMTAGAASSRDEALIRALTENSQMEHEESKLLINKNQQLFRSAEMRRMEEMPHIKNKNIKIELENLEEILSRQNMKIFFHDASDKELGIPAVIAFVTRCNHDYRKHSMTNFFIAILQDHLDSQRYDEAIGCVNKFQAIDKTNPAIYEYFRGSVHLWNHQFQNAIQCYKSVIAKIKADRVEVACLINCGICYQAMGDKTKALDFFMKAREKTPAFQVEFIDHYRSIMQSKNVQLKEILVQAKAVYEDILWKKKVDNSLYVFTMGTDNKIAVVEREIVEYLKITGKYQSAMLKVTERSDTKEEATRSGVTIMEHELRSAINAFRILNNLSKANDMESWLKFNNLSWETFEEYIETELIISKFKDDLVKNTDKATYLSLPEVKKSIREMACQDWLENQRR
jgi:tetratricopeptide (TPR) repeat protein